VAHHAEGSHLYRRCAGCGFVFLHPVPTAQELLALYQEEAGATFHHSAEIAAGFEKRLEARWRLRILAPALAAAPDRSAWELGCGAGYLLDELRKNGWLVAGTEAAEEYVRFARDRLGLEVDRAPPARRFGAVLLFNVLSHLPDPRADLEHCARALLPGGVLALETGNAAEVPPRRVGPFGAPEHVWHFSEPTLRAVLDRAGFGEVRVRRFNVEWQRRALRWMAGLRRGAPGESSRPSASPRLRAPAGAALPKRLAIRLLLGLRFGAGRLLADRDHFCTLFVWARRRG
jgi:SAM-dependent methyltransferase